MAAVVQHASNSATFTSGTSGTLAVTISAAAAGNCLVAAISAIGTGGHPTVTSVDTGGSAENWAAGAATSDATNTLISAIWTDANTAGGGTTVNVVAAFGATASSTNSVTVLVDVYEVSGVVSSSVVDQTTHSAGNTETNAWSSGTTGTTTLASEIAIGAVSALSLAGGSVTLTGPSSPWVNESVLAGTVAFSGTSFPVYGLSGYQVLSSTSTVTYNGSSSSASTVWDACVLTLKGAPPAPLLPQQQQVTRIRRRGRPQPLPLPSASGVFGGTTTLPAAGSLSTAATQGAGATLNAAGSISGTAGKYLAGLTGTGYDGYFTDNTGTPVLLWFDEPWALPTNAGRWGGTYQSVMDAYTAARSAQGHTAFVVLPWGDTQVGGAYTDGRSWDGVYPFSVNGTPGEITNGSVTVTLNNTYWQRIDYLVNSAYIQGLTVIPCLIAGAYDISNPAGGIFANLSTTQAQAIGTELGTRYLSSPNMLWLFGDDNYGSQDALYAALLTGIRSAGDTRPISNEYHTEMSSRAEMDPAQTIGSFGLASASFDWVYTYNLTYVGIEFAYGEAAEFSISPIPVIWGDGWYWGMWSGGTQAEQDQTTRIMTWQALASGARGVNNTDLYTWQWTTGAATAVTSDSWWANSQPATIRAYFESLPGWWKLYPDTSSVLVTSGRGTKASVMPSGGTGEVTSTAPDDTYVCASRVSDGSLAVIYCASAFSITIDQTQMVSEYTATWVDPASCATVPATPGSTYSSSGLGNNSAGNPDWVLVLQEPSPVPGSVTLAGTGSVNAPGSVLGAGAALAAAGSLSTAEVQGAGATLAGTGAVSDSAAQGAGTTLGAAGSLASPDSSLAAASTLAGTASLTSLAAQRAITVLAGTGSVSTGLAISGSTALGAAGSLASPDSSLAAASTLAGTASLTSLAAQRAITVLAGTGSLTASEGAGLTESGPFNITLPGAWARVTSGAFTLVLPVPQVSLTGFPGTLSTLAAVLPKPVAGWTGTVRHNPFTIRLPALRTSLTGKVIHNPFNIKLPAPHTGLSGLRAHAGPFTIQLGRARGSNQNVVYRRPVDPALPPAPEQPRGKAGSAKAAVSKTGRGTGQVS